MKSRITYADSRNLGKNVEASKLKPGYIIEYRGVQVNICQVFPAYYEDRRGTNIIIEFTSANGGLLASMGLTANERGTFSMELDNDTQFKIKGFKRPKNGSTLVWGEIGRGMQIEIKDEGIYNVCEIHECYFMAIKDGEPERTYKFDRNRNETIKFVRLFGCLVRDLAAGSVFRYRDQVYKKGEYVRGIVPVYVCELVGTEFMQNFFPLTMIELIEEGE